MPGLTVEQNGVPDVMRGEEVQVFGALALTGLTACVALLPGTHSKWVQVEAARVTTFRSAMTGEFYALLAQHSILARTLQPQAPLDKAAFLDGVLRAGNDAGLLHNAFGARTLSLFGRLSKDSAASYLSGLLIGEELRVQQPPEGDTPLLLVGAQALAQRYALALQALGTPARTLGAQATWAGLHAAHKARTQSRKAT